MICVEVHSNNVLTLRSDTLSNAVSNSIKHETIKFLFPDNWNNYQKTAVFSAEGVEPINVLLCDDNELCLSQDECYIPFEVLNGDYFEVSVFGVRDDSLATTTKEQIEVLESGYARGDQPSEPTQSEYSQILQMVIDTKQIVQTVRDDADNGVFKGDKGDKGDSYILTEQDKADIVAEVTDRVDAIESDIEAMRHEVVTLDRIEPIETDVEKLKQSSVTIEYVSTTYATKDVVDGISNKVDNIEGDVFIIEQKLIPIESDIDTLKDDLEVIEQSYATKQYVDDAVASSGGSTGGGGGVSSWNDLTDKPFYEGTKTATIDYADTSSLVSFSALGMTCYKATDDILTEDELKGSILSAKGTNANGEEINESFTITEFQNTQEFEFGNMYVGVIFDTVTFYIMVATKTGEFEVYGSTLTIEQTGTYFSMQQNGEETLNLMSLGYDFIKTLDIKYIPDSLYTEIDQRIENYINEALGGEY